MISTKSTKKFDEAKIVEILPNILKTLVLELIQSVKYVSLREIRMLLNVLRMVKYSIDTFPGFMGQVIAKLNEFIDNPEKRTKKHSSNLADIILFSIFYEK